MKKNFFILGLFAAVAFLATLAINKHSNLNHNQVPATAEVQPEPVTTTTTQTSEEPAPVAQVQVADEITEPVVTNKSVKVTLSFRSFSRVDKAPINHVGQP